MLNKVLVAVGGRFSEIWAPEHWLGPKKVTKNFFELNFGGFTGILEIWSKLQKVIILRPLGAPFEILGKSLTVFEILEKRHFAP